jgi:ribonuclease P protein component
MPAHRFTKSRRVRRHGEFQQAFERGIRAHGRYLTVLMVPNKGGVARLGIVASRKLGGAVDRNRAKRLIRELFRRTTMPGRQGVDVVIIPRRELFDAAYSSLEADFLSACRRCASRLGSGESPRG